MATEAPTGKALHPLDVRARLAEFRELRDGWADGMQYAGDWGSGYGKMPNPAGLDWLAAAFEQRYPAGVPLPHTYPTPEGEVRMEWSCRSHCFILEIDLATHQGRWLWFDQDSDDELERVLDLDAAQDWEWFAGEIRARAAGAE